MGDKPADRRSHRQVVGIGNSSGAETDSAKQIQAGITGKLILGQSDSCRLRLAARLRIYQKTAFSDLARINPIPVSPQK